MNGAFYHVHWYKYPLTYWLNIITSLGCLEGGDLDIAYLSEIDPTWTDSSLTTILNPEAVIFANPTFMNKPKDILSPDAPFIQTGRDVVTRMSRSQQTREPVRPTPTIQPVPWCHTSVPFTPKKVPVCMNMPRTPVSQKHPGK